VKGRRVVVVGFRRGGREGWPGCCCCMVVGVLLLLVLVVLVVVL